MGNKRKKKTNKIHKLNRILVHDLLAKFLLLQPLLGNLRGIKQPRVSVVGSKANARFHMRDICLRIKFNFSSYIFFIKQLIHNNSRCTLAQAFGLLRLGALDPEGKL